MADELDEVVEDIVDDAVEDIVDEVIEETEKKIDLTNEELQVDLIRAEGAAASAQVAAETTAVMAATLTAKVESDAASKIAEHENKVDNVQDELTWLRNQVEHLQTQLSTMQDLQQSNPVQSLETQPLTVEVETHQSDEQESQEVMQESQEPAAPQRKRLRVL